MGHQLLLTSSVPHSKYTQTVSTLEALTGLRRPQVIATYNILTKPHNVFKPVFEPGKVNQIEQYHMRCTTTWHDDASKNMDLTKFYGEKDNINVDRLFAGKEVKHWTLHISDIPNAGKNPVSAQNFYESTVVHHHSRRKVQEMTPEMKTEVKTETGNGVAPANGAQVKSENGTQIKNELDTHQDPQKGTGILDPIEIDGDKQEVPPEEEDDAMQVDMPKENTRAKSPAPQNEDSFLHFLRDLGYGAVNQYWLKGVRFFHGDVVIEIFKVFVTDDTAQAQQDKIKLQLLDLSNTFQIRAYISYPKGASVDAISKGTKSLTELKGKLHNLFELDVPDRMSMDSRVPRA